MLFVEQKGWELPVGMKISKGAIDWAESVKQRRSYPYH